MAKNADNPGLGRAATAKNTITHSFQSYSLPHKVFKPQQPLAQRPIPQPNKKIIKPSRNPNTMPSRSTTYSEA